MHILNNITLSHKKWTKDYVKVSILYIFHFTGMASLLDPLASKIQQEQQTHEHCKPSKRSMHAVPENV